MADPPHDPWALETVYMGGGTPSRLGGDGIGALLGLVRDVATVHPAAEVTLEANPEDVTRDVIRTWRAAGVSRLSLGAQSFDDKVLQWMHRTHSAADIARAVATARQGGIDNISLDLIFALPEELGRNWTADLDQALALTPTHLSLYGLTVEPRTTVARWIERSATREAPDEAYEAEFLEAHKAATAAGYIHYEVSNFSRPGYESRHNSAYWMGNAYEGVGPAAHGYDGHARRWNIASYAAWLRAAANGQDPIAGSEWLTETERRIERLFLELRTSAGTVITAEHHAAADRWAAEGWAVRLGDRLRLTPRGWVRMDAILVALTRRESH